MSDIEAHPEQRDRLVDGLVELAKYHLTSGVRVTVTIPLDRPTDPDNRADICEDLLDTLHDCGVELGYMVDLSMSSGPECIEIEFTAP